MWRKREREGGGGEGHSVKQMIQMVSLSDTHRHHINEFFLQNWRYYHIDHIVREREEGSTPRNTNFSHFVLNKQYFT